MAPSSERKRKASSDAKDELDVGRALRRRVGGVPKDWGHDDVTEWAEGVVQDLKIDAPELPEKFAAYLLDDDVTDLTDAFAGKMNDDALTAVGLASAADRASFQRALAALNEPQPAGKAASSAKKAAPASSAKKAAPAAAAASLPAQPKKKMAAAAPPPTNDDDGGGVNLQFLALIVLLAAGGFRMWRTARDNRILTQEFGGHPGFELNTIKTYRTDDDPATPGWDGGRTWLHIAAMDGKTSAIDPLVRKGLHIDQDMTNEDPSDDHIGDHFTPLHFSAYTGQVETTLHLIKRGATAPYPKGRHTVFDLANRMHPHQNKTQILDALHGARFVQGKD